MSSFYGFLKKFNQSTLWTAIRSCLYSLFHDLQVSTYQGITWEICWSIWLLCQTRKVCRQKFLKTCCPDLFFVNSGIWRLGVEAKLGGSGRATSPLGGFGEGERFISLIPRNLWWNQCARLGEFCKSPDLLGLWENRESAPKTFPGFPFCLCPGLLRLWQNTASQTRLKCCP